MPTQSPLQQQQQPKTAGFAAPEGFYQLHVEFKLGEQSPPLSPPVPAGTATSLSLVTIKCKDGNKHAVSSSSCSSTATFSSGTGASAAGSETPRYAPDAQRADAVRRNDDRVCSDLAAREPQAAGEVAEDAGRAAPAPEKSRERELLALPTSASRPYFKSAPEVVAGDAFGEVRGARPASRKKKGRGGSPEKEKDEEFSSLSSFFSSKRRRAKNNNNKNSAFASNAVPGDNLSKTFAEKDKGGSSLSSSVSFSVEGSGDSMTSSSKHGSRRTTSDSYCCNQGEGTFLFFNVGRSFVWSELYAAQSTSDLYYIDFHRASPTTHDINLLTRSSDNLDIVIGFNSGEIFWYNPFTNQSCRLKKGGMVSSSPVTSVRWMPGSETRFMAACADGSVQVYDRERDIQPYEKAKEKGKEKEGAENAWNK
ncbi:MAG: hypothetical protein BJ554DRAFT_7962, partial [Olpidium bornovanus]